MKKIILSTATLCLLCACTSQNTTIGMNSTRAAWGTGIGVVAGAGVGAAVGGLKGALIGAGIGAVIGVSSGIYIETQAQNLIEELKGTGVQVRVLDDKIYLIMPDTMTFKSNQACLCKTSKTFLNSLAKVINSDSDMTLYIIGHTDSTGPKSWNETLSLQRAQAVSAYLKQHGVSSEHIKTIGKGAQSPIASNMTADGRKQNRRFEIILSK